MSFLGELIEVKAGCGPTKRSLAGVAWLAERGRVAKSRTHHEVYSRASEH